MFLRDWRFFHCFSSTGCTEASPSAPSLCAASPELALSPPLPCGVPPPAGVDRPLAAEVGLSPPSVELAPAFPPPLSLPFLSPAAAASKSEKK